MTEIEALCRKYGVEKLAIFGSFLRDDFKPDSDVDFLVKFRNNDSGEWGCKYNEMQDELTNALCRKVDLVSWNGVQDSRNWIRRESILNSATLIYGW